MSELPKGWKSVNLIDFVYSVPTGVPEFSGKRKYYSTGSINGKGFVSEGEYSFDKRPSRANRIAMEDDIFQARMQGTDKALLITELMADQLFSTGFLQLRPITKTYDSKLLYYFVKSDYFLKQRDDLATGSTQIALTDSNAANLELIVPPLNEQRRIVAKLEKLLHRVDACKERLDKIPVILKRFRQSVLSAACSGRLTKDWREKNTRPLTPSPQGRGKKEDAPQAPSPLEGEGWGEGEGLPDEWQRCKLGDMHSHVTSGSRSWAKYYAVSGAIFIRAQNINADFLDLSDVAYVRLPNSAEGLRTKIQLNDLLVTITGANVTKSAIVLEKLDEAYVSQHVALVRLKEPDMSSFAFLCLISPSHGRAQLLKAAYGQGKPGLNLNNIRDIDISLPPLSEQHEIVRRVEALFKKADEIEARYKKAKAFVDKLTQSILAKAFRGELVPQEPDDEPASVLLERVKVDKARQEQKKKGKKI